MRIIMLLALVALQIASKAQDDEACINRILAQKGSWGQFKNPVSVTGTDLETQKKFLLAAHQMIQAKYIPMGVNPKFAYVHPPSQKNWPVNAYAYNVDMPHYVCKGDALSFPSSVGIALEISFNQFGETNLYDTTDDVQLTGYLDLRHGWPIEVKPGIWQFPDDQESLGFGITGKSKLWLVTYDGKLPWAYVTQKEFLQKRKRNLQRQLADQDSKLKEQLDKWETEKKYTEQQLKNDAAKLAKYIDNTYKPAIEREHQQYQRATRELKTMINKVDEQLANGGSALDQSAIVKQNPQNALEYLFTDKSDPFAQILAKPNPAYFNRNLQRSVPQFISVEIIFNHQNAVHNKVMDDIVQAINLNYLKSFIGKSAPAALGAASVPAARTVEPEKGRSENSGGNPATSGSNPSSSSPTSTSATANPSAATPTGKGAILSGTIGAPAGVVLTLANNNANDLSVTLPKTPHKLYNNTTFSFSKPVNEQLPFEVTLKKMPAGMKGVVFHGKGRVSEGMDKLKVSVDYTHELVSRSTDDKVISGFYESGDIAIGGYQGEEGRFVAFISVTVGLEGNNGKFRQVFWRDRNTGITKLVSVSPSGQQANADSYMPTLSADGKRLVFESAASNLVEGDNNNAKDIFLWDAQTNRIQLVSASATGTFPDAESYDAAISGNGQFVIFTSSASNLAAIPKGQSITNVFIRDLAHSSNTMISIDPGTGSGGNGGKGSISFDGSRATFSSATNGLAPKDQNGQWDIFLWQRGQSVLRRVSLAHDGSERNQGQESATRFVASSISGDGRYVAFASTASNLVANDNNTYQDVFVHDTETGKTIIASQTMEGQPANNDSPIEQAEKIAISYDGAWVAFPTKSTNLGAPSATIILHHVPTGRKQVASSVTGSYVGRPVISYSGSYVLFGKSDKLDERFPSSGIFAHFTGNGPGRDQRP